MKNSLGFPEDEDSLVLRNAGNYSNAAAYAMVVP